jgi:hypothetical protein
MKRNLSRVPRSCANGLGTVAFTFALAIFVPAGCTVDHAMGMRLKGGDFPAPNGAACTTLHPNGMRPRCGKTVYDSANHICTVVDVNASGCMCHEYEVKPCLLSDPTKPCAPGQACGVRTCDVSSHTSSSWSATCKPLASVLPAGPQPPHAGGGVNPHGFSGPVSQSAAVAFSSGGL